jgi:tRNA pseudouridine38-40 synthase
VAGEVLGAIRAIDPSVVELRGASRTDAGVHARGQLAAFDPKKSIPPKGWALGLSAHLPREIAIRGAARVPYGANPRHASIRKRYRYLVFRDTMRDPFWEGRAWRLSHPLDLDLLRAEAALVTGTHDFKAFRSSTDARTNTIRTIEQVALEAMPGDPRVLTIDVVGTAFLHNMVRIVVGTFLDVARGRLSPSATARALASGDRADLGITAPAHGLYLEHIEHAIELEEAWPPPPASWPLGPGSH